MVLLQGVTTVVNVPTLLSVLSVAIVIGGLIWKLADRIRALEAKVDTQGVHFDERMKSVDTEVKHALDMLNLRLKVSDDKDEQILKSLALVAADMKVINASLSQIEKVNAINEAISKARTEVRRDG
jgi:hypothetical protein